MSPLTGKRVVVIGGSSGIGRAVVDIALADGASVVVSSSSQSRVDATVKNIASDRVSGEVVDATSEQSIKEFFEKVGKFDHLVYTAAGALAVGFPDVDLSASKVTMEARLWGLLACAKHSRTFISSTGSITVTSGTVDKRPLPGWSIMAGAGGAIVAATRGLALDLAPLRVNCIAPGLVDTELWATTPADVKAKLFEDAAAKLPVKHVAKPDAIAEAYLFAMRCTYLTGQTIYVDGGQLIV